MASSLLNTVVLQWFSKLLLNSCDYNDHAAWLCLMLCHARARGSRSSSRGFRPWLLHTVIPPESFCTCFAFRNVIFSLINQWFSENFETYNRQERDEHIFMVVYCFAKIKNIRGIHMYNQNIVIYVCIIIVECSATGFWEGSRIITTEQAFRLERSKHLSDKMSRIWKVLCFLRSWIQINLWKRKADCSSVSYHITCIVSQQQKFTWNYKSCWVMFEKRKLLSFQWRRHQLQ